MLKFRVNSFKKTVGELGPDQVTLGDNYFNNQHSHDLYFCKHGLNHLMQPKASILRA